jgi:hypothetical protein
MNASQYWRDFAAWVKGRNQRLRVLDPIPVESWADRKIAYERAQRAHRGQADAHASLRKATNAALIEQIFADEAKSLRLIDTHPWLIRDPHAFAAMVKAIARQRIAEAQG